MVSQRIIWRWARGLLVLASLAWAFLLLAESWPNADLARLSPALTPSLVAFLLAVASVAAAFPAFWWCLQASGATAPPMRQLMRLHFAAQLMRHLPGRFIGVAYQMSVARHLASIPQWLVANLAHMAMAVWFALVLPVGLLAVTGRLTLVVASLSLAVLLPAPYLLVALLRLVRTSGGRWLGTGRLARAIAQAAFALQSHTMRPAFVWFFASWLLYALAWAAFGTSLEGYGAKDGIVLCALYTVAWAVGFAAVVTPSGLGVRELVFAAMARDFPPEVVAYTAVLARMGLLAADMFLGLLSFWIGHWRHD